MFSIRVADDFVLDGGRWELAKTKDRQPVARIDPPVMPMFQQVVEYLERKPVPPGGNFRRDEESRAAVAVCLRWGSEKATIRQAQGGVHAGPKAMDMLKFGEAWPPSAEQVLPFLHPLVGPARWSHTEQSRAVELPLRRGAQQNQPGVGVHVLHERSQP